MRGFGGLGTMGGRQDITARESELLDALSRDFRQPLTVYFLRRLNNPHDADDLVQEVFARLMSHPDVGEMEGARGYVFETAQSVFVDWLRRRSTRHADKHCAFDPAIHGDTDFASERVILAREQLAQATAILMELPELTRTIFVLRRMEGMKYKEIAKRLGISVSTAEKSVRQAMVYLMERLAEK
jgi:RNA polymerase sigma-70 factor (ECF subfamily)